MAERNTPKPTPPGPRIAIKFGAPSASKPSSKQVPSTTLGKRSRPNALGANSDSEGSNHDDSRRRGGTGRDDHYRKRGSRHEGDRSRRTRDQDDSRRHSRDRRRSRSASPIELGGTPLIIQLRTSDRDWKSELRKARQQRQASHPENEADTREVAPADKDSDIKWGLNVSTSNPSSNPNDEANNPNPTNPQTTPKEQTLEEQALDNLMGKAPPRDQKVIPLSEADKYARDIKAAPEIDSLKDLADIDPDEFGAAMLRGMGWNGDTSSRPGIHMAQRRQNQLGLGAKHLKAEEDLGQWDHKGGKGSKSSRPPKVSEYNKERERRREEKGRNGSARGESYKEERERERREGHSHHHHHGDRHRDWDRDRDRDRHRHR